MQDSDYRLAPSTTGAGAAAASPSQSSSTRAAAPLVLSLSGAVSLQFPAPSTSTSAFLANFLPQQPELLLHSRNLSAAAPIALAFNSTDPLPPAHLNERLVQVLVLAAIFLAIVIGNVPVVLTILFGRLGRTRMYYFLLHLCFADLLTGLFSVIPQLAWELTRHFHGGNILCKTVKYLQILGPYLSSYTLTAMSIDRFLAICHPLTNNHLSLYRAKQSLAIAWFLSLLFCVPQALIFSYVVISDETGVMECWAEFPSQPWGERLYVTWYAISVFIVPFFIIFYTHFRICCELWRNTQQRRCTMKRKSPLVSVEATSSRKTSNSDRSSREDQDGDRRVKSNHHSSFRLTVPDRETTTASLCQPPPSGIRSKSVDFVHIQRLDGCELLQAEREASPDLRSATKTSPESAAALMRAASHDEEHLRAKIKSVKLTVTVILCYVFCSLPFIVVQLWANWYPGAQESSYWTGQPSSRLLTRPSLSWEMRCGRRETA